MEDRLQQLSALVCSNKVRRNIYESNAHVFDYRPCVVFLRLQLENGLLSASGAGSVARCDHRSIWSRHELSSWIEIWPGRISLCSRVRPRRQRVNRWTV